MSCFILRSFVRMVIIVCAGWATLTSTNTSNAAILPNTVSGLVQWLNASDQSFNNNDPVGTWTDSSVNLINAVAPDSDSRPTFKTNVLNGQPAVQFVSVSQTNTASDYLNSSFPTTAQPLTIFLVGKIDGNAGSNASDYFYDGTTAGNRIVTSINPSGSNENQFSMFAGGAGITSTFTKSTWQQWHLYTGLFNTATSQMLVDGGVIGTGSAGANSLSGLRYGARFNEQHFLNGYIAEVIIYNRLLTSDEMNIVGGYLEDKYALNTTFQTPSVPEPSTLALLGLGFVAQFIKRRRMAA